MDSKLKHLEFIQTVINRMAGNSFLLKGWAITLVGGLLALSFKELDCRYIFISLVVIFFFWLLDSFYLSRERLFICLYESVRTKKEDEIDFSLSIKSFKGESKCRWTNSAFSQTMLLFYGGLFLVHLFIIHSL